jgi:hypothetical protein
MNLVGREKNATEAYENSYIRKDKVDEPLEKTVGGDTSEGRLESPKPAKPLAPAPETTPVSAVRTPTE